MTWRLVVINGARKQAAHAAAEAIMAAPAGTIISLTEPPKSRLQESKYHPMVRDIGNCLTFGGRKYNEASWKRLLVEAFVNVMRQDAVARGDDDPFPGSVELVLGLDDEVVALGQQTRTFSRAQSSEFIEYLYAYGSENNVAWGIASRNAIEAMLDRRRQQALQSA